VEYLVYGRDNPDADALLEELAEAHWSFMDGYADVMIARGPTLTPDRSTHTGSLHIVDLPDANAARNFAFDEPYYRAGVYRDVLIRRWRNELARTMWDFRSDARDPRFLIIGLGQPGARPSGALEEEHRRFLVDEGYEDRTILRGPLLSDDGAEWVGSAMLVELADRAATEAMVTAEPQASAGLYSSLEIHDWQFGGRP
jgi:hypothetical protein